MLNPHKVLARWCSLWNGEIQLGNFSIPLDLGMVYVLVNC